MFRRLLNWRSFFYLLAMAIVAGTAVYTQYVARKIEREERQRVEEWIYANRALQATADRSALSLANMVIVNNEDMPLIATTESGVIVDHRNLDSGAVARDSGFVAKMLEKLKAEEPPLDWVISDSPRLVYKVYHGNTALLNEVRYYPFVQLLIIALFILLLIALINTQSKSTQNQVWAGMAKETAHQLGTPITSLQGWVEMLEEQQPANEVVHELGKDVNRLKLVSDRFSKIGSTPQLEPVMLVPLVQEMVTYMKRRAPERVKFEVQAPESIAATPASPTLIHWVLENLLKNALDALDGSGFVKVTLVDEGKEIWIDVADNGKGISASHVQRVFDPGFTTKKRGWGLGLSLSKRIVEQYHKGQLFVKHSAPGEGTTFRMVLPR